MLVLESLPPPPCLVLLDMMMPVMSGPELLHELEQSGRLASLPVVGISAGMMGALHVHAFLRKPVAIERPLRVVERYCSSGRDEVLYEADPDRQLVVPELRRLRE